MRGKRELPRKTEISANDGVQFDPQGHQRKFTTFMQFFQQTLYKEYPSINFPSAQRRPTTDIGTGRRCRPTSVPGRQREAANGGPTADINSRLMSALVGLQ